MSAQEPSQGGSDAGSVEQLPQRRDRWLPSYFARLGQAQRAPGFWRAFSRRNATGSASAGGGDVETGERLLSRERTSTDDSVAHEALTIRPNSGAAAAGPPAPADDIEAAPAAGIREAGGAAAADEPAGAACSSTGADAGGSADGSAGGSKRGSPRSPGGGSPGGAAGALRAFLGRRASGERSGGLKRSASSGNQQPVCLICLDALEPEDFESGEAIVLECACRGELALRHRTCAEKWARVKGDSVCDVCKAPIRNLPAFTPRAPASEGGTEGDAFDLDDRAHPVGPLFLGEQMPGSADIVFDCIRITWIATIVAVLFLNLNLPTALVAGLIVGVGYTLFARAMYRQQIAALQREYLREHPNANPTAVVVEPRGGSPTAGAGAPGNPGNPAPAPANAAPALAAPAQAQGNHAAAVV